MEMNSDMEGLKQAIGLLVLSVMLLGCEHPRPVTEPVTEVTSMVPIVVEDTLITEQVAPDVSEKQVPIDSTKKQKRKTAPEAEPIHFTRMMQFPGDAQWNGKPMVQQYDLKSSLLQSVPDTLKRLALESYASYKSFFPRSISDDFENGISTEHVHYPPRLVFEFQLFENEFQGKPYAIRTVVVKRTREGELYIEE